MGVLHASGGASDHTLTSSSLSPKLVALALYPRKGQKALLWLQADPASLQNLFQAGAVCGSHSHGGVGRSKPPRG